MINIGNLKFNTIIDDNIKDKLLHMNNDSINQILLETFRIRSQEIIASDLLKKYINNNEFFGPSEIPLKKINAYNILFCNSIPEHYKCIDLSPINPLGTNSSITNLSQNLVLSTIKNSEVCGDPTTALTLEVAKIRKSYMNKNEFINNSVDLATISKVLRMQQFDKNKGYMQHFNLFGLSSGGRKTNECDYNLIKLKEHIMIWLNLCENLKKCGFDFGKIEVGITSINLLEILIKEGFIQRKNITENSLNDEFDLLEKNSINLPKKIYSYNDISKYHLELYKLYYLKKEFTEIEEKIIKDLNQKYPNTDFYIDLNRKAGLGYYNGLCFHIYSNKNENIIQLADGGITDWNKKLLSDKKELNITSGFGAELILKLFGKEITYENIKEVL